MTERTAGILAELETLERPALQARWAQAFSRPAPERISRDLLLRALAYCVQEHAEGGLGKAALRRLANLTGADGNHTQPARPPAPRLKPGTRLVREWRAEVHQVTVTEDGFAYQGARYGSLSQIARAITGTRWSGPLFFGLRKARPHSDGASDAG